MLETVRRTLGELPQYPFQRFFQAYVLSIQDINIEEELQFMIRNNFLNNRSVARLIDKENFNW